MDMVHVTYIARALELCRPYALSCRFVDVVPYMYIRLGNAHHVLETPRFTMYPNPEDILTYPGTQQAL
jgi:hypothetical protein